MGEKTNVFDIVYLFPPPPLATRYFLPVCKCCTNRTRYCGCLRVAHTQTRRKMYARTSGYRGKIIEWKEKKLEPESDREEIAFRKLASLRTRISYTRVYTVLYVPQRYIMLVHLFIRYVRICESGYTLYILLRTTAGPPTGRGQPAAAAAAMATTANNTINQQPYIIL